MQAKKSLGQNFLKSKQILGVIVETAGVTSSDAILEIGPGKGALTEALLNATDITKIIAIEKDDRMIPFLQDKFRTEIENKKLELIHGDILETNLKNIIPANTPYKLVANIPYYITGAIIEQFLTATHQPTSMTLLVQKEVAKRIVAKDKKESILSLSVKIFGRPKYIKTVSKKHFSPSPKVDSAILHIDQISKDRLKEISEEKFFETIKLAFSQKRKMAIGNLSKKYPKDLLEKIFTDLKISTKARAENIDIETWIQIIKNI